MGVMARSVSELVKRYAVFLVGLLVSSFGIALVTKASLGTSPISSIPYSLSLILPQLSLGGWTIVFSLLLVAIQIVLLRRAALNIELVLQLVVSFSLGYLIDIAMWLLGFFSPHMYILEVVALLIGCVVLALGIYLQLEADVVMMPGDALVRAISRVSGVEFGRVRVISDTCMTAIAAILCIVFLGGLAGVREGTIVAALLIGNLVRLCAHVFPRMFRRTVRG